MGARCGRSSTKVAEESRDEGREETHPFGFRCGSDGLIVGEGGRGTIRGSEGRVRGADVAGNRSSSSSVLVDPSSWLLSDLEGGLTGRGR